MSTMTTDTRELLIAAFAVGRDRTLSLVPDGNLLMADFRVQDTLLSLARGEGNPCPYALSHTRHFCGYPLCRES